MAHLVLFSKLILKSFNVSIFVKIDMAKFHITIFKSFVINLCGSHFSKYDSITYGFVTPTLYATFYRVRVSIYAEWFGVNDTVSLCGTP